MFCLLNTHLGSWLQSSIETQAPSLVPGSVGSMSTAEFGLIAMQRAPGNLLFLYLTSECRLGCLNFDIDTSTIYEGPSVYHLNN